MMLKPWSTWYLMGYVLLTSVVMWAAVAWYFVTVWPHRETDPFVVSFGVFFLAAWGLGPVILLILSWRRIYRTDAG